MKLKLLIAGALLAGASGAASADDNHGCTVLLCLANPAGPKAAAACVDPITKLFKDLAKGKGFPSCAMASAPGGGGGKSWAEHGANFYDDCPAGTSALGAGAVAVSAGSDSLHTGIGEGSAYYGDGPMSNKTCVGNQIGEKSVIVGTGDSTTTVYTPVYDKIVTVSPNANPHYIDVYIDSVKQHRVHVN